MSPAGPATESGWAERPRPARTKDNEYYWDGMTVAELRLQQCLPCGTLQHPPEPRCMSCGSSELGWSIASGRGEVFSHVTCHEPQLPGFECPYVVAVVTLAEGPRVIANVIGADAVEVRVGDRVMATFRQIEENFALVAFERSPT